MLIHSLHLPGAPDLTRGIRVDGNQRQDSLVFPQELTQITNLRIRELYRPLKWRRFIDVEPVASWAQQIEDRKIQQLLEDPVDMTNKGPTGQLPMPSFSKTNQYIPMYEYGLAYGYTDRDAELASHIGFGLVEENVMACNLAFENFLEKVASTGSGVLKGLGNLADVSPATAVNKGSGSNTAWTGTSTDAPTQDQLVQDLHIICNTVQSQSKENAECNLILVPLAQYQILTRVASTTFERTALARFQAERPGVRIEVWDKLKDQGGSQTPCAMGWDTRDIYGPRMLMQKEATYGTPLRGTNGWLVPAKIATGGVRCINPTAVVKMSGL